MQTAEDRVGKIEVRLIMINNIIKQLNGSKLIKNGFWLMSLS